MAVPVDEIGPAVFVDVANEDRHAGMLEREFRVQFPLAFERIGRRFEPAGGNDKIAPAVAVDIAEAQPVAAAADADHVLVELARSPARRIAHEAVEDHVAGRVGHDLHVAVAIDIPEAARLDRAGLVDHVRRPLARRSRAGRVLAPGKRLAEPSAADDVGPAVAVDVHRVVVERIVISADGLDRAELHRGGKIGAGIPVLARDDVLLPVAVDVANRRGFKGALADPLADESGLGRLFKALHLVERHRDAALAANLVGQRQPRGSLGRERVRGEPGGIARAGRHGIERLEAFGGLGRRAELAGDCRDSRPGQLRRRAAEFDPLDRRVFRRDRQQVLRSVANRQHKGSTAGGCRLVGALQREPVDERIGLFRLVGVDDVDPAISLKRTSGRHGRAEQEDPFDGATDAHQRGALLGNPGEGVVIDAKWHGAVVDNAARAALFIRAGRGDLPALGNPLAKVDRHFRSGLDLFDAEPCEGVFGQAVDQFDANGAALQVGHVPLERHQGIVARGRRLSQFQAGLVVDQRDVVLAPPAAHAVVAADRESHRVDRQHEGRRADFSGLGLASGEGGEVGLGRTVRPVAIENCPSLRCNHRALHGMET